ncbi:fibro-slime domain-containing protein [Myxococcus eversor]|uniref:fibro-slime domain-containing protein n=1 Tax=Myxococcus eversor TaxID=2709661 RepID=UPI0013D35B7C|nr:fibro-slime domain-containing protein [Myxococcus eversor]
MPIPHAPSRPLSFLLAALFLSLAACGDNTPSEDDPPRAPGQSASATGSDDAGTVASAAFDGGSSSICGDAFLEDDEECDDGNHDTGDGCSPLCTKEPQCTNGVCASICGDGVMLPGSTAEACDDGNTVANDGCSPTCQLEPGFTCQTTNRLPSSIPIVYRDFRGYDLPPLGALPRGHIDFQNVNQFGEEKGLVQTTLNALGKPAYAKTGLPTNTTSNAANFAQWYLDTDLVNKPVVGTLTFIQYPSGQQVFDAPNFFPVDDLGWVAAGAEAHRTNNYDVLPPGHNYSFTTETRFWFEYKGTERFTFQGDDDVWVFINRRLAIDMGGLHVTEQSSIILTPAVAFNLGLTPGGIYEVAVFHAERKTSRSWYHINAQNFGVRRSACVPTPAAASMTE